MTGFQKNLLYQGAIPRFHVKLWEGNKSFSPPPNKLSIM